MTTLSFAPLIMLMFYLPLTGMHQRLVHEKEKLIKEANDRINRILSDIHQAAFEEKDLAGISGLISVRSVLLDEKKRIEELSTWPWRPGTFRGLLSALLLPVVLSILRDAISGLLGL